MPNIGFLLLEISDTGQEIYLRPLQALLETFLNACAVVRMNHAQPLLLGEYRMVLRESVQVGILAGRHNAIRT
jgi:hypothetical protein